MVIAALMTPLGLTEASATALAAQTMPWGRTHLKQIVKLIILGISIVPLSPLIKGERGLLNLVAYHNLKLRAAAVSQRSARMQIYDLQMTYQYDKCMMMQNMRNINILIFINTIMSQYMRRERYSLYEVLCVLRHVGLWPPFEQYIFVSFCLIVVFMSTKYP